jgi:hypothetical protein
MTIYGNFDHLWSERRCIMTASEVLEKAKAANITLQTEGDDLVVTGPREAVVKFLSLLRQHKADLVATLREERTARCPACGSVGHQHPGAPGCDRREVLSARRYPAPLLWRGSEDAWAAGEPQPPLPVEEEWNGNRAAALAAA